MMPVDQSIVLDRDRDFQTLLLRSYRALRDQDQKGHTFRIKLRAAHWISAASLNLLVLFVLALRRARPDVRVHVDLFGDDAVNLVQAIDAGIAKDPDTDIVLQVTRKLIFFETMDVVPLLLRSGASVQPGPQTFSAMQRTLQAKRRTSFYRYSSRILGLNPLIDSPADQAALTARMQTLTNILYRNLFSRLDAKVAREASAQIMFELVKNIYQHCGIDSRDGTAMAGLACAQIVKYPLIQHHSVPSELVRATLEGVKASIPGKQWRFLSISITDHGIGLSTRIREYVSGRLQSAGQLSWGKHTFSRGDQLSGTELIKLGVLTDFSTKPPKEHGFVPEKWKAGDTDVPLEGKGYGLVYCLAFIARCLGRMRIHSEDSRIEIFARPEAALQQELWQSCADVASLVRTRFDEYFFVVEKNVDEALAAFPGTQVLIELPVEVWLESIPALTGLEED